MGRLNRRRFLAAAAGVPVAIATGRSVSAASTTHSLWMLDPDWGYPLATASGSDVKSRCRARACHRAAPNRFFLSRADALAGRLHPCCLAQPVNVEVCIDMNALMPFHRARLGGVDRRCPELPDDLRNALASAAACVAPPTTTTSPSPTPPGQSIAAGSGPREVPTALASPTSATDPGPPAGATLPSTGTSIASALAAATVATVGGAALVTGARHRPDS